MKHFLVFCLLVFIQYAGYAKPIDNIDKKNQIPILHTEDVLTEIPIDYVKGITQNEVINICREILGEIDDANRPFGKGFNTGFKLGYRCNAALEYNDIQYYAVTMSWLVNDNHWSYIGDVIISANGDEIYEGHEHSDGTYSFGKLLWRRK